MKVVSASISSSDDGTVNDVFRIHDSQERKARSCPGALLLKSLFSKRVHVRNLIASC